MHALAASLEGTGFVRRARATWAAVGLTMAEATVAALLVLPATSKFGFAGAALLMAVLTGGVVAVLRRGAAVSCRCFGHASAHLSTRHVIRNGPLTTVAVAGLLAPEGWTPLPGHLTAALTGVVLSLPLILLDDVAELVAPARRP